MINIDWAVSQGLSGQQIDSELYRLRADHENRLRQSQAELKRLCNKADTLKGGFSDHSTALSEADPAAEVDGLLASAQTALADQKENLTRAKQECEAYRLRHGLTCAPIETNKATSLLFLLIVIFAESGVNAAFFQNAHMAASPFAALLTSLLISITNVTLCACAGYFVGRWLEYGCNASDSDAPEFVRIRFRATLLFWGFLVVMAFFHGTVGLIRATESLDQVLHNWINYQDLLSTPEAFFLILAGACLSVLAYHKGKHSFDDAYPGYGLRHRAVKAVQDALFDSYEDTADEIEERFADAQDQLKKQARQQYRLHQQYNQAVSHCYRAHRDLERAVATAESELRMQVAQLASAHRGSRGQKAIITGQALDHLVHFDGFLDDELPAYIQNEPDPAPQTELARAKSAALARLSRLFEDALKSAAQGDNDRRAQCETQQPTGDRS